MKPFGLILLLLLTGCFNEAFTKNSNSHNTDNTSNVSTTNIDEDNTTVFDSGASDSSCADIRPSDGEKIDFTWKPISEADGNAVVLLPAWVDPDSISTVCIVDSDCAEYRGKLDDGRLVYRFPLPGSDYDGDLVITETNGTQCEIEIFDNAARQD